jgi:hypothetical protein
MGLEFDRAGSLVEVCPESNSIEKTAENLLVICRSLSELTSSLFQLLSSLLLGDSQMAEDPL